MLDPIVASLGYAGEPQANIRAIIATRLDLLLSPLRAARLCWPDSTMISRLMSGPAVVTLADLGDDEERSFLVLVLTMAVRAMARLRGAVGGVRHLLVLEEAHRVIPDIPPSADPEATSAAKVSADLLSGMLAEVRAYGEQVLVVDQSPSRVSPEVLRNTNLKIVHRVVHPDDQVQVAGAMSMLAQEGRGLGLLRAGQAGAVFKMGIVHAEPFGFGVHQLHKLRFAAGHGFGQGDGGIIAGLYNHPFEQIVHAGGGFRVEEHARTFRFPALFGHGKGLIRFELAFFQRFMEEQGIIKRLKRMGLKEGDSIRIYGHEFEYLDSEGDDFPASEKEEE